MNEENQKIQEHEESSHDSTILNTDGTQQELKKVLEIEVLDI